MKGKYNTWMQFVAAKLRRGVLRSLLSPLVKWTSLQQPEDGYTVILGVHGDLMPLLIANVRCLGRIDTAGLKDVIVVIDRPARHVDKAIEKVVASLLPGVSVRFAYYTNIQYWASRIIDWGWVNSWMSWCKGVGQARTRYVMIHDFDAFLLSKGFASDRYLRIRDGGIQFLGVRFYKGNGVELADCLVTTFELFFDAEYVRREFKPIDVFNHVCVFNGRSVDFDTFLHLQARGGSKEVVPACLNDMVHPSQLICQYTMHKSGDKRLPLGANNLLLLPYFLYLGDDVDVFSDLLRQMEGSKQEVMLFGRLLDWRPLTRKHADWLVEQARHLESALYGQVRPEVQRYLELLGKRLE